MNGERQRCRGCHRYAGFGGFNEAGLCPECAAGAGPANEIEADLQLRRVVLRVFGFGLHPLHDGEQLDGLELRAVAHELGLTVSLRFERSEFVNIATTGLHMLDAADEVA